MSINRGTEWYHNHILHSAFHSRCQSVVARNIQNGLLIFRSLLEYSTSSKAKGVKKSVREFLISSNHITIDDSLWCSNCQKKAESIINSHEKESNIEEFCLICDKLITFLNGFNVNEFQDTAVKSRIQTLLFTLGNSIRGEVYKHGLSLSGFIKFSYVERS